jgi:hypothetical protein
MMPMQLLSLCSQRVEQTIEQIDAAPTTSSLLDIATVSELIVTLPGSAVLRGVSSSLRSAALRWLRSGLIEDIMMTRAEHSYHMALLVRLASVHDDYKLSDVQHLSYLCAAGACLRGEMPSLTLRTAVSHLARSGVSTGLTVFFEPNEALAYDKRVLRPRNDEQDFRALFMILQLRQLGEVDESWIPRVMPQAMLYHVVQKRDFGALATLALLNKHALSVSPELLRFACMLLAKSIEELDDLLPITSGQVDTIYAPTGLRVRNSLACCALLDGELDDV